MGVQDAKIVTPAGGVEYYVYIVYMDIAGMRMSTSCELVERVCIVLSSFTTGLTLHKTSTMTQHFAEQYLLATYSIPTIHKDKVDEVMER